MTTKCLCVFAVLGCATLSVGQVPFEKRKKPGVMDVAFASRGMSVSIWNITYSIPGWSDPWYIHELNPRGPAALAGLEVGDVIVKMNETVLSRTCINQFQDDVGQFGVGEKVLVHFERKGVKMTRFVEFK